MRHYGDITQIHGDSVPIVDVVTGGSPCQDLSVAGKRAGLAGERSGLFMEQIRIIKEMREHDRANGRADVAIRPRFMVWENVPGAFSSNYGEDFRAVLEETAKVADKAAVIPGPPGGKWSHAGCIMADGWSIAWRVHDAQFWGVPQRRKRISLVADFAGGGAAEILFEREGVSGNPAESREQGQSSATDAGSGVTETGRTFDVRISSDGTKNWRAHAYATNICRNLDTGGADPDSNHGGIVVFEPGAASRVGGHVYEDECCGALRANAGDNQQAVVYGMSAYDSNSMKSSNPHSGIYKAETARTLDLNGGSPACNQGGMMVVQGADVYNGDLTGEVAATLTEACGGTNTSGAKVVCLEGNGSRPSHRGDGYSESETMYTLNSTEHHAVAVENHPADSRVKISEDGMVQTLSGRMGTEGNNVPMVMEQGFAMQAIGEYKQSKAASSLKMRDYKDATDLVVASFYPQMKAESQCYRDDDVSNTLVNGTNPGFQNGIVTAVDCRNGTENPNINGTLQSKEQGYNTNSNNRVRIYAIVRRLTPLECERLQGFPDYWTDIGDWVDSKGKKHKGDSDSPRYKALGNSIALPFWEWMAKRMVRLLKNEEPTMASLFDGIGGFPLSFSRAGVKPVWCSEIEEFPIAVTKIRFPD